MSKRKLFLLVIMSLLIALIAACGRGGDDPEPTPTPPPAEETGNEVEPPPEEEGPGEDEVAPPDDDRIDFGGAEFVWRSPWARDFLGEHEGQIPDETQERFRDQVRMIEEYYNVVINFEPIDHLGPELVSTYIMAGELIGDVLDMQGRYLVRMHANDFVMPFNNATTFDPNDPAWNTTVVNATTWGGNTYGVWSDGYVTMLGLFVNDNLRASLNLEPIEDVYRRGDWNWDTFLQYMIAATDRANNQFGVVVNDGPDMHTMLLHSNGFPAIQNVGGRLEFMGMDPRVLNAFDFFSNLFHLYSVAPTSYDGIPFGGSVLNFAAGQSLFIVADDWIIYGWNEGWWDAPPDWNVIQVPLPMGPDTNQHHAFVGGLFRTLTLPANNPDPDRSVTILRALLSPIEHPDGWEPLHFWDDLRLNVFREDFSIYTRQRNLQTSNFDWTVTVPDSWLEIAIAANDIRGGYNTPVGALEAIMDVVQADIDENFNNR